MILRELFYTDRTIDNDESRYVPANDSSVMRRGFTRRTRLTLQQINQARRADDLHATEKADDLNFIKKMYGIMSQAQMTGEGGDMGDMGGF